PLGPQEADGRRPQERAGGGDHSSRDVSVAELDVLFGNDDVAEHGEREPGSAGGAVDGDHQRGIEIQHAAEELDRAVVVVEGVERVVGVVGTAAERVARTREHDGLDVVRSDVGEHLGQLPFVGPGPAVAVLGTVEPDDGDAVVEFDLQERVAVGLHGSGSVRVKGVSAGALAPRRASSTRLWRSWALAILLRVDRGISSTSRTWRGTLKSASSARHAASTSVSMVSE